MYTRHLLFDTYDIAWETVEREQVNINLAGKYVYKLGRSPSATDIYSNIRV